MKNERKLMVTSSFKGHVGVTFVRLVASSTTHDFYCVCIYKIVCANTGIPYDAKH